MSALPTRLTAIVLWAGLAGTAVADSGPAWDGSEPAPGIYFHWYEPSFYAGFAPRTQDPARVHLELSRGNQQRLTLVLGPDELDTYLEGLLARRDTVRELVDRGVIELTTNRAFERFTAALDEAGVDEAVAARETLGPEAYRQRSAEILTLLNPGRIFPIRIPLTRLAGGWHAHLAVLEGDAAARLDAANAVLPGRVNLYQLTPEIETALENARTLAAAHPDGADPAFEQETARFLALVTGGRYPLVAGEIRALELTAIYPAGTAKAWTRHKGMQLPDFGVTGVWPLLPREHGKGLIGMVDYLSTNPGYGFIPLLGYQYAGGIAYNALHNAGVRAQLDSTPFLPKAWIEVRDERDGKPYQNLWIGSRGPASHGCTRLPSGHMSELRDALPSTSRALTGIDNFRNAPQCFDVFDVDGDGRDEVMGVRYFLAYWGEKHTPKATYAPNDREGFYAWLYGDDVAYGADGSARLREVPVCRFRGLHKAEESAVLADVPLYEAPYAPEAIQFYVTKPVSFKSRAGFELNRELRRIGGGYTPDRRVLLLEN